MATVSIEIRAARPADAGEIAEIHDEAWLNAYRGIIPPLELARMVARRGPGWWQRAVLAGTRVLLLEFEDELAGYASYGACRWRKAPVRGEIHELYLKPAYQGVGLGRRLFAEARGHLAQLYRDPRILVWALAENEAACGFYRHIGGREIARVSERFGEASLDKAAFLFERD